MSSTHPPGSPTPAAVVRREFPGGSRQSRWVERTLRTTVRPLINAWSRHPDARWPYRLVDWTGRALVARPVARTRVALPNCPATLQVPANRRPGRFILYLHGGGFIVGGRNLHRQMTARFATDTGAELLAVDYRKVPRHTIPDAVADCVDGYERALSWGFAPESIVIMGDSAGATLTLMTALELRRRGLPQPAALVVMSPLTDFENDAKFTAPSAHADAIFSTVAAPILADFLIRTGAATTVPAPARADLTGLPPTLIQVSSTELLYPDGVLMAQRLHEHGVPCELQVWDRQVHIFQAAAAIAPEAAAAVAEIRDFVDRHFGASTGSGADRRTA
ncbi:alpha/beta hydrolase [Nocardia sp. SSK8]|uniref:alpha/beta hydrolase n=1 Tax=Nocardia sp. SSK8 TaxID=3120154 RepID=UPI00300979DC